jgi:hypothetical protein
LAFAESLGNPGGEKQVRTADFDVIPSIAGARLVVCKWRRRSDDAKT